MNLYIHYIVVNKEKPNLLWIPQAFRCCKQMDSKHKFYLKYLSQRVYGNLQRVEQKFEQHQRLSWMKIVDEVQVAVFCQKTKEPQCSGRGVKLRKKNSHHVNAQV